MIKGVRELRRPYALAGTKLREPHKEHRELMRVLYNRRKNDDSRRQYLEE